MFQQADVHLADIKRHRYAIAKLGSAAWSSISDVNREFLMQDDSILSDKPKQLFAEKQDNLRSLIYNMDSELGVKKLSFDVSGPILVNNGQDSPSNKPKQHKLTGHKLAYKMDRPKPINLKKDFRVLKQELKEQGEDHLEGVMTSTID